MGVYTHVGLPGLADAVEVLPDLTLPLSAAAGKTGTDGAEMTHDLLAVRGPQKGTFRNISGRRSDTPRKRESSRTRRKWGFSAKVRWRARQGSNLQPSDSKSVTLSIELRAHSLPRIVRPAPARVNAENGVRNPGGARARQYLRGSALGLAPFPAVWKRCLSPSRDRGLAQAGLLSAKGCADAGRLYIWADTDQRTIETGRALAEGMFPDCAVQVHSLPEGSDDPLFSPINAGIGRPDRNLAAASVAGRIGGHPQALLEAYRPALETMQHVLAGCKPGPGCRPVKQSLLELPAAVGPGKADRLAEMTGPLATASTLAQNLLLEYANGMAGKELGWGRLNESNLRQMMSLHTAYADLLRQTPYIGRAQVSNLLSHVLKAMEQAVAGKAVAGALGKPGDRVVVIVGHDTNLSNISGMLGLSWLIPGYQRDDTPPGGTLVFELWQRPANGEYTVRTYYICQTLEQMRKALPLTLTAPPAKAPVFLPGCSTAEEGFACGWKAFQRTLESAIDPAFVKL